MIMRIRRSFWSLFLHTKIKKISPSCLRASAYILAAVLLLFLLPAASTVLAESAAWNLDPTSRDWNTAANWTPATVPNGPNDTATFGVSNITAVTVFDTVEVNGIIFDPGASAYTISHFSYGDPLGISGAGITNNSGIIQNFVNSAVVGSNNQIWFTNSASAGSLTVFFNDGNDYGWGSHVNFYNTSTAANGTFINDSGVSSEIYYNSAGYTEFNNNSTAANGTFINNGGLIEWGYGGYTEFNDTSTAGNGTFINNAGTNFGRPGNTRFTDDSTGGRARVEVFGDGHLNINGHNAPGVTLGSIEGTGYVFLGANNLTVGTNHLSTTFSGLIDGIGGSLTKVGAGTLALTGPITYTGGTTLNGGKLVVSNKSGSGTGTGPVQVNKGTLRGRGTIAGPVTLGTGSGSGAVLSPGEGRTRPRTLTIQSTLTFNADATYNFGLNSKTGIAGKVVANGVTIVSGAQFSFAEFGNSVLSHGTVFTAIDNTAGAPITGTFSNLPDGSTVVGGSNTYQVSYEGGNGNDLTLTVQ
jgi:autotransporter-associated beta strand protein